ncbi:MAG: hypothetical protein JWM02_2018 [Frankiales bacterium]|nr:hypothetical protein [Frankiales bacterium]
MTAGATLNDTTITSETVDIDAPQHFVWSVLTDYARYPDWNPYTVRVEATLELGGRVELHLPDPNNPGQTFKTVEWMSVIDPPHHLQYNTGTELPGIHAVRDQWVEDLGGGRSSYRTTDVFTGDIAKLVFDLQGEWVTQGFNATAHALKAHAEQLWSTR